MSLSSETFFDVVNI